MLARGGQARYGLSSHRPITPCREWSRESDQWRAGNRAARMPLHPPSPRQGLERPGPRPRERGIEAALPDRDMCALEFWRIVPSKSVKEQAMVLFRPAPVSSTILKKQTTNFRPADKYE